MKRSVLLSWITVGFVYFLMFWGNLVSATGSGLACPDWPLCHGTVLPPPRPDIILEWGHRTLAAIAGVLILTLIFQVFKSKDASTAPLKRAGRWLIILLFVQVLLGGTTVLLGLSPIVSTIHLIIATVVFSGLIAVAVAATWGKGLVLHNSFKVQRLAKAGLIALIVQVALGAMVRHNGFGLSCSRFPNCLESFLPIPLNPGTALAFTHRWWGVLLLGIFIHLPLAARNTAPRLRGASIALAILAIAQVLLGIATVHTGLHTHMRATHAAVGYAIWGILFFIALRSGSFRFLWDASVDHRSHPGKGKAVHV